MKSRMIMRIKNRKGLITPFNLDGHGRRISGREYIRIMLGHLTTQLKGLDTVIISGPFGIENKKIVTNTNNLRQILKIEKRVFNGWCGIYDPETLERANVYYKR